MDLMDKKFRGKPKILCLDLGCGSGHFFEEYAKREIEVIGIDFNVSSINRAKRRARDLGFYAHVTCADAHHLPLKKRVI